MHVCTVVLYSTVLADREFVLVHTDRRFSTLVRCVFWGLMEGLKGDAEGRFSACHSPLDKLSERRLFAYSSVRWAQDE